MRVIELCKFTLWLWNWFSSYATLKLLCWTLHFNYNKMAWHFHRIFWVKTSILSCTCQAIPPPFICLHLVCVKNKTTSSRAVKFPERRGAYLTIPLKSQFNWDAAIFWVAFCLESVPCFYDYPVAAARASASGGGGPCKIIAHSIHVLLYANPHSGHVCVLVPHLRTAFPYTHTQQQRGAAQTQQQPLCFDNLQRTN